MATILSQEQSSVNTISSSQNAVAMNGGGFNTLEFVSGGSYPGLLNSTVAKTIAHLLSVPESSQAIEEIQSIIIANPGASYLQGMTSLGKYMLENTALTPYSQSTLPYQAITRGAHMIGTVFRDDASPVPNANAPLNQPNGTLCESFGMNAIGVPFQWDAVIQMGIKDLVDPKFTLFRELNQMQNTTIGTGSAAVARNLSTGFYSNITAKTIVPPLMPCVKLLQAVTWGSKITTAAFNRGTYDVNANPLHITSPEIYFAVDAGVWDPGNFPNITPRNDDYYSFSAGAQFTPTRPIDVNVRVFPIGFNDFLRVTTQNQALVMPQATQEELRRVISEGSAVVVPITSKIASTRSWCAIASGFTGFNGAFQVDYDVYYGNVFSGSKITTKMRSNHVNVAWSLSSKVDPNENSHTFVFVCMDESIPATIGFNDDPCPPNQFTLLPNYTMAHALLEIGLSDLKDQVMGYTMWLAGPLFPLVNVHASRVFRPSPVFEDAPNANGRRAVGQDYCVTDIVGPATLLDYAFERNWYGTYTRGAQVNAGNYERHLPQLVVEQTSSLPYRMLDSLLWCMNSKNTVRPINFNSSAYWVFLQATAEIAWNRRMDFERHAKVSLPWDRPQSVAADAARCLGIHDKLYPKFDYMSEVFVAHVTFDSSYLLDFTVNPGVSFPYAQNSPLRFPSEKNVKPDKAKDAKAQTIVSLNAGFLTVFDVHYRAPLRIAPSELRLLLNNAFPLNTFKPACGIDTRAAPTAARNVASPFNRVNDSLSAPIHPQCQYMGAAAIIRYAFKGQHVPVDQINPQYLITEPSSNPVNELNMFAFNGLDMAQKAVDTFL